MAQSEAPMESQAPDESLTPGTRPGADGAGPAPEGEPGDGEPQQPLPDLDALLERYDPEVLRKSRKLMGIAGGMADKLADQRAVPLAEQRARQLAEERVSRAEAERSRQAALEAARRGDFESLGQRRAREVLQEDQARHIDSFRMRATHDAYDKVQSAVNEIANGYPPEVVALAAERLGELPSNLDWEGAFKRWLPALIDARAEHLAQQPETQKKIEAKLTPALRSRLIAEMNGTEPAADSGGGRPQTRRTLTDEQIEAMSPEEWVQVYDVKAGKFKPGIVHKPTRSIDPSAVQGAGRGF